MTQALGLDETSGYQGALRAAVHSLEETLNKLGDPELQVMMLMLRRHEKDFMLRGDPKYIARLQDQLSELRALPPLRFGTPASHLTAMDDLQSYETSFLAFTQATIAAADLRNQLSDTFSEIEPSFEIVNTAVSAARLDANTQSAWVSSIALKAMIGSAIFLVLLIATVLFVVGRSITLPLGLTARAMRKFAEGDTTAALPDADRKDEIGDMVRALQVFRKAEEDKRRMEAEALEAGRTSAEQRRRAEPRCDGRSATGIHPERLSCLHGALGRRSYRSNGPEPDGRVRGNLRSVQRVDPEPGGGDRRSRFRLGIDSCRARRDQHRLERSGAAYRTAGCEP
ncbi:HAMP domain-containing protein [Jiella pelagia]|uniref:HAMP domain-containing protein n=1 Tax=Jiella pelagia TaxID=2986949 RepID=UPI0038B36397